MGIPVVASNQGGIPELIEHGRTGLLAEVGQVDSFVDALGQLHSGRVSAVEICRRARSFVEQRFGMDRVFGSFQRLMKRLPEARTTH